MTYIVGWKRDDYVYVCADTVATVTQASAPPKYPASKTSFDELEIDEVGTSITQSAVKLLHLGRAILAICGDANVSRVAAKRFNDELTDPNRALREAFEAALAFTESQTGLCRTIRLIVAAIDAAGPRLLAFDGNCLLQVTEFSDGDVVQFGSIPESFHDVTKQCVDVVAQLMDDPKNRLACLVCNLQSYGINFYLLEHGVGGAFFGAYVSSTEIHWQGDILFLLYTFGADFKNMDVQLVSTGVRDNVFFIQCRKQECTNILTDSLSGSASGAWFVHWMPELAEMEKEAKYDYFSWLAIGRTSLIVAEIRKQHRTPHLVIQDVYPKPCSISVSEYLRCL